MTVTSDRNCSTRAESVDRALTVYPGKPQCLPSSQRELCVAKWAAIFHRERRNVGENKQALADPLQNLRRLRL